MDVICALIYILVVSIGVFFAGRIFPRKFIFENKFPFRSFKFEKNGTLYNKLNIRKWKTKLPDASVILHKICPWLIPKKRIEHKEKISLLIKETCIAEATHILAAALGFGAIRICKNIKGWIIALSYLAFNIPFVLIQRFNRPRLVKAHATILCKTSAPA